MESNDEGIICKPINVPCFYLVKSKWKVFSQEVIEIETTNNRKRVIELANAMLESLRKDRDRFCSGDEIVNSLKNGVSSLVDIAYVLESERSAGLLLNEVVSGKFSIDEEDSNYNDWKTKYLRFKCSVFYKESWFVYYSFFLSSEFFSAFKDKGVVFLDSYDERYSDIIKFYNEDSFPYSFYAEVSSIIENRTLFCYTNEKLVIDNSEDILIFWGR